MIYVFSGPDRRKIQEEIYKVLGKDYEVFDGDTLSRGDLMNIFMGSSLFGDERRILVKNLTPERGSGREDSFDPYEELAGYVDSPHKIVIWETTLSLKKSFKQFVSSKKVEQKKFDNKKPMDMNFVFSIYDTALRDGPKAVRMLETIEAENDPYMFFGLLVSQALKKYGVRYGSKEKRVLKELSHIDVLMKSSSIQPWLLLKSFLLQVSSLQ